MAAVRKRIVLLCGLTLAGFAGPVLAGPPFVTDDPEPTDTGHFENYLFSEWTHAEGAYKIPAEGVEINYGAFENTQLSWSLPLNTNPGPGGMGQVWEPLGGGVKYRFIQEDAKGWRPQVGFFPQVFIPVGAASHTAHVTELLPIWIQKSYGPWTTFGGGGFTHNPGAGNKNYLIYGWSVQRQFTDRLALGVEVFGQTHDTVDDRGSTAAGFGWLYDFDDTWHLVGSVNTAIAGQPQSDYFSYNLAIKWTR
jgi:hypothetical protein